MTDERGSGRRVGLLAAACAAVLAAGTAGCIPSQPLAEGEMDGYWQLREEAYERSRPAEPSPAAGLPAKWVVHRQDSLIWSTVSMVQAARKLRDGADDIAFSVSPRHTEVLAEVLRDARDAVEELGELARPQRAGDRRRWAGSLGGALARVERIVRRTTPEGARTASEHGAEQEGLPAEPVLRMLAQFLDERSDGALLAELGPQDAGRLREVLAHVVLKLGFAAAGKELPDDLRAAVARRMEAGKDTAALAGALGDLLAERLDDAPPASPDSDLQRTLKTVFEWTPRAVGVLEKLVLQWAKMRSVAVEFRRLDDRRVLAVTLRVREGQEVRVPQAVIFQPTIAFRGDSRIVVRPSAGPAGETVVAFEPLDGGAVEMRFGGILYGLVRLLALPLADARLREVRVFSGASAGRTLLNVAVFMEARGAGGDGRRVLVFQQVEQERIERSAFAAESVLRRKVQSFSYLTPRRRYSYVRVKEPRRP
jgi:hypothetical protein